MQIHAERFLALTAMLAGFVPTGPGERGDGAADTPTYDPDAALDHRDHRDHGDFKSPRDRGAGG